jgi:hypothetical protein
MSLNFPPHSADTPVHLPIVVSFITVPATGSGGFAYTPLLQFSIPGNTGQFYAPPDDLFACFIVSQTRGSDVVPCSFVLSPLAHLVLVADVAGTPTGGNIRIAGAVSGNISYA